MRIIVSLSAAIALCACSQGNADEGASGIATAEPTGPTIQDMAGTYDYTLDDGRSGVSVLTLDGVYTDTLDGDVETGTWSLTGGKTCFDPGGDKAEDPTRCYAIGKSDANGVQTATADDGSTVQVKKRPS